jgi:hypothetical protein
MLPLIVLIFITSRSHPHPCPAVGAYSVPGLAALCVAVLLVGFSLCYIVLHRSGRDTRSVFVSSLLSSGSSDAGDQGDIELIDDDSIVISSEPEQLAIDIDININVTQLCEEKELKLD